MEEIGALLPGIFRKTARRANPFLVEILTPLWPRVAGKLMAQNCRPVSFAAGTLTLATGCASWATELRRLAEEIRAEINCFLGEPVVKDLRVRYDANLGPSATRSSKLETRKSKIGVALDGELRALNFESPPSGPDAPLDPGLARLAERSFSKYFTPNGKGAR